MRRWFVLAAGALLLASCGPGQMLGPTLTPLPTDTPPPTNTPIPTDTPAPTKTPTPALTPTPKQLVLDDDAFAADYEGPCDTDAIIRGVTGNTFSVGGTLSIRNGNFTLWCYGAIHTWEGTLTYADHTFASDAAEPLVFTVDEERGYVYLEGKGSVTLPDGTVITLP